MKKHKPFDSEISLKIAQPRTLPPFTVYVPPQHPFAQRMAESRKIRSLWTPSKLEGGRK